jgi:uncharacterized protein YecA (UPF0149 family)
VNLEESLLSSYLQNAEASHAINNDMSNEGSIGVSMLHHQHKATIQQIKIPESNNQKNTIPTVGRNDPCPCGSGKKYKQCHGK